MSFDEHSIPRMKVTIAENRNKIEKSLIEVFEEENNEISEATGTSTSNTPTPSSRHVSGDSSLQRAGYVNFSK